MHPSVHLGEPFELQFFIHLRGEILWTQMRKCIIVAKSVPCSIYMIADYDFSSSGMLVTYDLISLKPKPLVFSDPVVSYAN